MVHDFPARPFVERLVAYGSTFGRQLSDSLRLPLRIYLKRLWPAPERAPVNPWLKLLARAMARHMHAAGFDGVDHVCDEFLRRPVIQQADHANIVLDIETFLNNYLFHIGAAEAGANVALHSQCTTVVCFSRRVPPRGPVFLETRGGRYNVFGLSKTTYKNATFCALPGPVVLALAPIEGPDPAGDPVLSQLIGRSFPNAVEAYRRCNEELWERLAVGRGVRRVQVDEGMAAEAVALHLQDTASPVYHLLFDPALRDRFLETKRAVVESSRNIVINRAAPDFFWYRKGARLHPVVVRGTGRHAELMVETDGSPLPITYEPSAIVAALRSGDLHSDRFLAYMVRSLLPGAIAVGGSVQQDYVDTYRHILLETHRICPYLGETEITTVSRPDLSRLGGMPLVELTLPEHKSRLSTLHPGSDLSWFDEEYLDRPVRQTIGRLDCVWFYENYLRRADARRTFEAHRKGSVRDHSRDQ